VSALRGAGRCRGDDACRRQGNPWRTGDGHAQTSPISLEAGERFGKALNALLASDSHRKSLGSCVYVFWTRAGIVPLHFWEPPPDAGQLARFLEAVAQGRRWAGDAIPNEASFYFYGLSANAARAVVRTAVETTVGELGRRQAEWFRRLAVVGPDGTRGEPPGLRALVGAGYREFKDVPASIEDGLVRAMLDGTKIPFSLFEAVVLRCRVGTRFNDTVTHVTYARAALLKHYLSWEETEPMEEEITGPMPVSYHCGRLFAELEDIQRMALGIVNAGITERFYGSASTAPASVFGTLLSGAQNHLSKLRKEKEGIFVNASRRLEEILAEIVKFPKTLTLEDQGLFSLGYYHHRAAKRKDIAARSAAKKSATPTTIDDNSEEEETK
jgi:CRISPR-associated protein Csd1